jgi:hypothetical protein
MTEVGDWLSDSISVGTATAADLSNKISLLSANYTSLVNRVSANSAAGAASVTSTELSAVSAAALSATNTLSTKVVALSNAVSILEAGAAPGGAQLRYVSVANTITGSAVTAVSGLSISVAAGGTYMVDGQILYNMSAITTTGIGWGMTYPQMAAGHGRWEGYFGSVNNAQWVHNISTFSANPAGAQRVVAFWQESAAAAQTGVVILSGIPGASAGRTYWVKVEGMFNVSAAGTIQVVCKQPQAEIVVLKGSFIKAIRIV